MKDIHMLKSSYFFAKLDGTTIMYSILLFISVLQDFEIIEGWIDPLVDQIKSELEPYQVTLFTNSRIKSIRNDRGNEIQRISADIPTVAVDLGQLNSSSKENLMNLPALRNPRKVSLHVVVHYVTESVDENLSKQLWDFFDFFVEATDLARRPKCLMIISIDRVVKSNELLLNVSKYAWTKKFLDVTILVLNMITHDFKPSLFKYNPFKKAYDNGLWDPDKISLFPDKLRNMSNYALRTVVFNYPPYLVIYSDNNSSTPKLDGLQYPLLPILSSYFNFTLLSVGEVDIEHSMTLINTLYNLTSTGTINLLPIPIAPEIFASVGALEFGSFFDCFDIVAIIPLIHDSRIKISSRILLPIALGTVLIFFMHGTARLLRFNRRYWHRNYIVRILFNFSSPVLPKRLTERLLFMTISVIALNFSNNFLMQLLDVHIVKKPPALNNFRNMEQSKIPVFVDEGMEQLYFSENDDHEKFVRYKTKKVPNIMKCVKMMEDNISAICLTNLYLARFLTQNMVNKTIVLKIVDPILYCRPLAWTFENGSPYVEKFSEVVQRVTESGIQSMWKYMKELEMKFAKVNNEIKNESKGSALLIILLICSGVGFGSAGLLFLKEFLCKPRVFEARKQVFGVKRVKFKISKVT